MKISVSLAASLTCLAVGLIGGNACHSPLLAPLASPKGEAYTISDLDLALVWITSGTFVMGSPVSEFGHDSGEEPPTRVTLTQPFWLGKTEVTQHAWTALMGNNPSHFPSASLPVENISWDDAMAFCQKLTEREHSAGRLSAGWVFTLPTEAQWEFACRAGTTGPYAGKLEPMAWYMENSGDTTHAVGTKQANAWGLADMHGNVWEWCADWFGDNLPGGSVSDPTGPASGTYRVNRGGAWDYAASFCRSADRGWVSPDYRSSSIGFRLALAATTVEKK